jgi:threonine/homoserine/homoserine lactone efflux protein
MTGSTPGIVITIVVVTIVLVAWIILVFYARLAATARQTAQRYTWPALARQIAAIYLRVTGKPRPP